MRKKENVTILLLCLVGIFVASLPLFSKYVFASLDTLFHTQRIWSIKNALEAGQFPVRIYSEIYDGYGYGVSLFYPELFLYFPAVLCMLGLPLAVSYNLFLICINVATMGVAYYSFRVITKSPVIGALAATLYELSTYRLLDVYTRGAMGEYLALIFVPLALCGLTLIKRGECKKWWILAIAYSGLLQSHILSFALMSVVAVIFAVLHWKNFVSKKSVWSVLKAVAVVILLNAWFIIPFLQVSKMNVNVFLGEDRIWESDSPLMQLFDLLMVSAGGTEVYGKRLKTALPVTPGILLIAGVVFMLFALVLHHKEIVEEKRRVYGYLIAGTLTLLMITNLFPWGILRKIPLIEIFINKFQFIWRFNILTILFYSIVAAYGFYYFFVKESANRYKSLVVVSMVAYAFAVIYFNQFVLYAEQLNNEEVLNHGVMDMLYVTEGFESGADAEPESNKESIQFFDVQRGTNEISLKFTNNDEEATGETTYIDVPVTYYPGYNAYIDGKKVETECSDKSLVRVLLPDSCPEGELQVIYEESGIVMFGNIVSVITLLFLAMIGIIRIRKRNGEKIWQRKH